jgi:calpain-7
VVTLGTGTRSNVVWEGIEVLPSHSYAVIGSSFHLTASRDSHTHALIDVDESEGTRTLTVLDTWVKPGQERQSKQSSKFIVAYLSYP